MPYLDVTIGAGTAERLKRLYRQETNDYTEKTFESDEFDSWFDKWLNKTLAAKPEREKEVSEMAKSWGKE